MRIPKSLEELLELGIIEDIVRPLQSGKEAQIYLVRSKGELRVAKIYKTANNRSFKNKSDYTEGRKVRNSRQRRAMEKKSRYGREELEHAWKVAELNTLYKLQAAGVRVPKPYHFVDGVLIMELVQSKKGTPAPRLIDISLSSAEAKSMLEVLIRDIVKMLCAGVVHGDLSDFNILIDENGPVIIDFPQACDPAFNRNARRLLLRDVRNVTRFMGKFAPHLNKLKYGPEMWDLYERGELFPDTELTGHYVEKEKIVDTHSLLMELKSAAQEGPPKEGQKISKYAARRAKKIQEQSETFVDPKPLPERTPSDKPKKKSKNKHAGNRNENNHHKNKSSKNRTTRSKFSNSSKGNNKPYRKRRGQRR